ncbi:Pkinase-domain-containing protein [Pleomassaria siparia CBS 279.74]|uniref:Pkinase-domain-containing protein n=1 Tax=Pleomassaria siparia CBS 279.74 TaxID=1314801 RepID=A0A6G1KSA8_9PLEO|nr:Pkinase-domain-containing protein [Pleomassaria siparia CBS 279.74]
MGETVAYFQVNLVGSEPDDTQNVIDIHENEQFYLGRNPEFCRHYWQDPTISNRHLRIHCVIFEQNPPLVYATDVSTNGTFIKKRSIDSSSSQGRGVRMGRKGGSFLLDDGDELHISNTITLLYRSMNEVDDEELTVVQQRETISFASHFLVTGRVLGQGGYGKVLVAIHRKTQRQFACKIIDLKTLFASIPVHLRRSTREGDLTHAKRRWPTTVTNSFREFDVLKDLSHPNIITIKKIYYSVNSIYIFQELVSGGDLFSYLEFKGGRLNHVETAVIIRQVLKGIEYLHEQGIVHRDLKPDNILMSSPTQGARVVITDFGNARFLPKEQNTIVRRRSLRQRMFTLTGTLEYVAPEVHKRNDVIPVELGYSKSVDMWSIGIITAGLLGEVLFTNRNHPEYDRNPGKVIFSLSSKCDLSVLDDENHKIWRSVGHRPKDFIRNLLVLREEDRMTATEALAHSWFSNKYHAAEFDAVYERAICDWQPHRKVFRLVEQIPESVTELDTPSADGMQFSEHIVSQYFTRPSQLSRSSEASDYEERWKYREPDKELEEHEEPEAYEERRTGFKKRKIHEEREGYEGSGHYDEGEDYEEQEGYGECQDHEAHGENGEASIEDARQQQQSQPDNAPDEFWHPPQRSHETYINNPICQGTMGMYSRYVDNDQDSEHYGYDDSMGEALDVLDQQAENHG